MSFTPNAKSVTVYAIRNAMEYDPAHKRTRASVMRALWAPHAAALKANGYTLKHFHTKPEAEVYKDAAVAATGAPLTVREVFIV